MKEILQRLDAISLKDREVSLYKNPDIKYIIRSTSKIPGKFDTDLFEFLKFTNGAELLDYCFFGCKNKKLGVDIEEFNFDLWHSNNSVVLDFVAFMRSRSGKIFGFLQNIPNSIGGHAIAYIPSENSEEMFVLASSFKNFLDTFLSDVESTIDTSKERLSMEIEIDKLVVDIAHWLKFDTELEKMYNNGTIEAFFKKHMPSTKWR